VWVEARPVPEVKPTLVDSPARRGRSASGGGGAGGLSWGRGGARARASNLAMGAFLLCVPPSPLLGDDLH